VSIWSAWFAARGRPVQALIALASLIVLAGVVALVWWLYTL
jgi:hypothetical protein